MTDTELTDHELLAQWRAGDESAGTTLVRRHFDTLSRFFRTKVNGDRADLMQKTLLGCVESRDRVPDDLPFRVYLLGIARRVLLHYYRSRGRAKDSPRGEISVADSAASPSLNLAMLDEEKLLLEGLRMLPLDMQLTLELHYWEGLKVEEVATVLEIPPGTVKSRLFRAKGLLREQIQALDPPKELLEATQANLDKWARSIRRFLGRPTSVSDGDP